MKKAVLILFIILPCIITAAVFTTADNTLSEQENRTLMTRGGISKTVKDGGFQEDLEKYLSDQFPFREQLVYLQSGVRYAAGQREIGGAYICPDGRLIQKITPADINEGALLSYADKINSIAAKHKVYVMYVPSACTALSEELPRGAVAYDYDELFNSLNARLGNAETVNLKEKMQNADYYYKTDHHWNAYGAYNAYTVFCQMKGEAPKKLEEFGLKPVTESFKGTLSSKVPVIKTADEILLPGVPALEVTADGAKTEFYDFSALEKKDKYNVFQGGNHGITQIVNPKGNGKTLLVLKDSFANSFVPYLAGEYSEIIMLDERYTFISLEDFVDKANPDEVLVLREITN